ncbi:hypothetical protein [Bacillus solitudinis]|uniref:hypothetical protein n=1 Tax=Bacillus solitudinis TaxID=2014074 RepID=UPI000C238305|nr:hypothetical protein [Bacillus solitudinis]
MSLHYYSLCQKYHGKTVEITTVDGQVHRGVIRHVNKKEVYIEPIGQRFGGFSYGYGWGGYYRPGFGFGIALGAIATLALLPFFFW